MRSSCSMSLPTPDVSHLTAQDYECIYEPAEDTFLFLDALEKDAAFIKDARPSICMEIGSGSGLVSTFLGSILGSNTCYLCTDINPSAADATRRTGDRNKVSLQPVVTNLVESLDERLADQVDLLLFNPPYVVTPSEEVGQGKLEYTWAGGKDGREVTDKLLPIVPKLLSQKGIFYLIVIKENKPDEIEQLMKEHGFSMRTVMSRRSGPEHLSVLCFIRTEQ